MTDQIVPFNGQEACDLMMAHISEIDPTEAPDSRPLQAYLQSDELYRLFRRVRAAASSLLVDSMEAHGTKEPVYEKPKSRLKKGEEPVQKVDEDGNPIFKDLPAEIELSESIRLRAAYPSSVKSRLDGAAAMRVVFEACGGDLDQFFEVLKGTLKSDAFRQGEIRSLLGDEVWDKMYVREHGRKVDETTPRKRQIEKINTFFVGQAQARRQALEADEAVEA